MAALSPTEPAQVVQAGDFDRAVLEELEEPFELGTICPSSRLTLIGHVVVLNQVRLGLGSRQ